MSWVTAAPGRIELRGHPLDRLARFHGFLDVAALLFHGALEEAASFRRSVSACFDRIEADGGSKWHDAGGPDPMTNVQELLVKQDKLLFQSLEDGCSERWATLLPWAGLVRAIVGASWTQIRDEPRGLIAAVVESLSGRDPRETALQAIEAHMVLQIESPNSPSSNALRSRIEAGGTPAVAWAEAMRAFATPEHGFASRDLACLLDSFKSSTDVESDLRQRLSGGERIPGFGSHEHKSPSVDPRVPLYEEHSQRVRAESPHLWFWPIADELSNAMDRIQRSKGAALLPRNPDFYMTLIHLAAKIQASYIPLTFLVARAMGWSAFLEEARIASAGSRPS